MESEKEKKKHQRHHVQHWIGEIVNKVMYTSRKEKNYNSQIRSKAFSKTPFMEFQTICQFRKNTTQKIMMVVVVYNVLLERNDVFYSPAACHLDERQFSS